MIKTLRVRTLIYVSRESEGLNATQWSKRSVSQKKLKVKGFLFDFDGTIVDSRAAYLEAARTAFVGLSTYFGTYTVDPQAQTVTHTVEGAMVPDCIGSKLVRSYRFLDPDRVELGVVPDAQVVASGLVLAWERVR